MQHLLSVRAVTDVILDTIRDVAAARRAGVLCCVLMVMGGVARAQTGGPADPSPFPAQLAKDDDGPPPGACKPIGLTVSGEVVFPLECREFIERALNSKPAVAATKPSLESKPSGVQSEPAATVARGPAAGEKPADVAEKPATAEERPASAETKSVEAKPVEAKPVEAKSVEAKSVETKPIETKPVETTPPAEAKTAAKPSEEAAPDNSQTSTGALEVVPLPKRADRRLRAQATTAPGCMHFRTYDAAAGTYRGFDGKIRPCR
jgi:hypothetical protein